MIVKVAFQTPDEVLAAIIRALVAKAGGLDKVRGTNEALLHQQKYYEFELNERQFQKLKDWAEVYIAPNFRKAIRISN